jgi:hypothetical protein
MAERTGPPTPVAELLRRSVSELRTEVPSSYRYLVAELGSLVVEVAVDDEVFSVHADRHDLYVDGAAPQAATRVRTSRSTLLTMLDAQLPLAEAVESGQVLVWGSLQSVVHAHDALIAYVHAAVRAPSVPGLLDDLRGAP